MRHWFEKTPWNETLIWEDSLKWDTDLRRLPDIGHWFEKAPWHDTLIWEDSLKWDTDLRRLPDMRNWFEKTPWHETLIWEDSLTWYTDLRRLPDMRHWFEKTNEALIWAHVQTSQNIYFDDIHYIVFTPAQSFLLLFTSPLFTTFMISPICPLYIRHFLCLLEKSQIIFTAFFFITGVLWLRVPRQECSHACNLPISIIRTPTGLFRGRYDPCKCIEDHWR